MFFGPFGLARRRPAPTQPSPRWPRGERAKCEAAKAHFEAPLPGVGEGLRGEVRTPPRPDEGSGPASRMARRAQVRKFHLNIVHMSAQLSLRLRTTDGSKPECMRQLWHLGSLRLSQ